MFHCEGCWETPCLCSDARGYKHLSVNELIGLRKSLKSLIARRVTEGGKDMDYAARIHEKDEAPRVD